MKVSEKVAEDYQRMEGKTYDFKTIIEEKYRELFRSYRGVYEEKEEASERL